MQKYLNILPWLLLTSLVCLLGGLLIFELFKLNLSPFIIIAISCYIMFTCSHFIHMLNLVVRVELD